MEPKHFNTKLCDDCQNIFRGEKRIWIKGGQYLGCYPHSTSQRSWAEGIHASAQQGCGICQILRRSLAADSNLGFQPRQGRPLEYFLTDRAWGIPSEHPEVLYSVVFEYQRTLKSSSSVNDSLSIPRQFEDTINVPISLVAEKDVEHLLSNRTYGEVISTGAKESWECISEWMSVCLNSHIRCNQERKSDWWPTRLLDVGDSRTGGEPRLIVTSQTKPSSPYITLSHRWGAAQFIQLKEDSLEAMKSCISIQSLPRTFRDAVIAAKQLGVRYLWIDSLCIIQGSSADWLAESSRMSDIYQNALCNLSATGAGDSEGGLFFTRNSSEILPSRVELSWTGIKKTQLFAVDSEIWERFFIESPLISRAWVVQERTLAPRVIHFGSRQLGWECQEKEHCEMFPKGFPPTISTLGLKNLDPNYRTEDELNDYWINSPSFIWMKIVREYSKRDLTRESDKEVAISGIATRIGRLRSNDTLVAGLWRRDLVGELTWTRADDDFVTRPKRYRAPSWSWLSVDGCIDAYVESQDAIKDIACARIEEIQVNRTGDAPLAPIQNGRIRLRGTLKKVLWSSAAGRGFCRTSIDDNMVMRTFYAQSDTYRIFENEEAWCLLLCIKQGETDSSTNPGKKFTNGSGIVLKRHGNQYGTEFTRAGSFSAYNQGLIPLLAPFLDASAVVSTTNRLWKELLHRHGWTSLMPADICAKIGELKDSGKEVVYNLVRSINFEELPTQTITIW